MKRAARLRGFALASLIGAVGCGSSSTAPSGPCASDEETASLLYGPPQGVTTSGDTTTYTWGGQKILFIAQGSSCVEQQGH